MTEAWHAFPSPGLIKQLDGSLFAGSNCAAATWAGLIVAQQQGKHPAKGSPWYPSGSSMRVASGDRSGGILPSVLDATTNRVYGIDLEVRIATVAGVQKRLDDGFAVGNLLQYRPLSDAGYSNSPGFYGAHSEGVYGTRVHNGVIEWLMADPLADGRRDGITRGMEWIPRTVVVKADGALVIDKLGTTMNEQYGPGHIFAVFTTRSYHPTVPPIPSPGVVLSAPASAEERANPMLRGAYGVTSSRVMRLAQGQPVFASPGGPRVTSMSKIASVSFLGKAGSNWGAVLIGTGIPYTDKVQRPTGLYVPLAAGPVTNR